MGLGLGLGLEGWRLGLGLGLKKGPICLGLNSVRVRVKFKGRVRGKARLRVKARVRFRIRKGPVHDAQLPILCIVYTCVFSKMKNKSDSTQQRCERENSLADSVRLDQKEKRTLA